MLERTCDHEPAIPGAPGRCTDCGTSLAAEQAAELLRATAEFLALVVAAEQQALPAIRRQAEALRQAVIAAGALDRSSFVLVPGPR